MVMAPTRRKRGKPAEPQYIVTRGPNGTGFVAAGRSLSTASKDDLAWVKRKTPWQDLAWAYANAIPEIKESFHFLSSVISRVRLYPAKLPTPEERRKIPTSAAPPVTSNPEAIAAFERLAPSGDFSRLLRRNAMQMLIPGECFLVGFAADPVKGAPEEWVILSKDEVRIETAGAWQIDGPGGKKVRRINTAAGDVFIRLWTEDDRYSQNADSPMSCLLNVSENLLILDRAVRAISRSRIVQSGIMAFANEMMPSAAATGDDDETVAQAGPPQYLLDMMDAIARGVEDEGDPAATNPIFAYGDAQWMKDFPRFVKTERPFDDVLVTLIQLQIKRMSIGLPLPAEQLEGLGSANHFGAWLISQDTYSLHAEPLLNTILHSWNTSYYQPMLTKMGVRDAFRHVIAADASHLIIHPNRTRDIMEGVKENIASRASARAILSLKESDAPTFEEMLQDAIIARAAIDPDTTLAYLATQGIDLTEAILKLSERKQSAIADNMADRGTIRPGQQTPSPQDRTGLQPRARTTQSPPAGRKDGKTGMIAGAVAMSAAAAVSKAGARIRTQAKRNRATLAVLDGVPNAMVASTIGRDKVAALELTDAALMDGAFDDLQCQCIGWGLSAAGASLVASHAYRHALGWIYAPSLPRDIDDSAWDAIEEALVLA